MRKRPYRVRKGREPNIHALPLREQVVIKMQQRKKPKLKTSRDPLTGFLPLTHGWLHWKGDDQPTIIDVGAREHTLLDIYLRFVDADVIKSMKNEHISKRYEHRPTTWELYAMHAVKMALHVSNKPCMEDNFPLDPTDYPDPMGRESWFRLEKFLFEKPTVRILNRNYCSVVTRWGPCCIDEKHKPSKRKKEMATYIRGKKPPWGYWISDCSVTSSYTGLPFVVHEYPVQDEKMQKVDYFEQVRTPSSAGSNVLPSILFFIPKYLDTTSFHAAFATCS